MKLTRNRIQCPHCKDIIESKHRHDFVTCKCWDPESSGVFIDGGLAYQRWGGHHIDGIINLAEHDESC